MLEIYKKTKVYIACPAYLVSGGAELLNQLCYSLRNDLNIEAYMYYYPTRKQNPVYPDYKNYNNPYLKNIEDDKANIIVVPEIESAISLSRNFSKIRKVVWFLGLDCYFASRLKIYDFLPQRIINKICRFFGKNPPFEIGFDNIDIEKFPPEKDTMLIKADLVMINSYRGIKFLKSRGFNPTYLSEYVNDDFLKTQTDLSKKENIVVFNPKKGHSFTRKIIKSDKYIRFVPLVNMSREEIIKNLQRSKVYIDFGNHSGKDRIPREAAILGCCVITGKRGSAAFYNDVSIPAEYKFDDKDENILKIIDTIKDCFENYNERVEDFNFYRSVIRAEKSKFIEDVKSVFIKETE